MEQLDNEINRLQRLRSAITVAAMGDDIRETWVRCKIGNICTCAEFQALVKNTLKRIANG